jgi:hypothetical protein
MCTVSRTAPGKLSLFMRCCLLGVPALLLAGCGGGGGDQSGSSGMTSPPRGTLLQSPPELLSTVTTSTLLLELNSAGNQQVLALSGPPVCDVLMYHIEYATVGGANEATTASAALMVPTGTGTGCTRSRPIVLYAHGATTDRSFNMADTQNGETLLLAALFASQGYIVVAPNYAGYDTSTLPYHPYLIADQQSKDMIDALQAATHRVATWPWLPSVPCRPLEPRLTRPCRCLGHTPWPLLPMQCFTVRSTAVHRCHPHFS